MKFQFNEAQLDRVKREKLRECLGFLQEDNEGEIEVNVFEFPDKFKVMLDDDVELVVVWDDEKSSFSKSELLPEPELEPEPEPEPESHRETDPIKLAELTYDLLKDFRKLTPEQKITFTTEYVRLWEGGA